MTAYEQHVENLVRHIDLVRNACLLLGQRLISAGRKDFGRILIARGFVHDASKFYGIEWKYLHRETGEHIDPEDIEAAVQQHITTNSHHPEYWGGFSHMPEICLAEMVCDWYARSQEFGTGLKEWIKNVAIDKFHMSADPVRLNLVWSYVAMLLNEPFKILPSPESE